MDVRLLMLTNGQQLIAEVISTQYEHSTVEKVVIRRPLAVHIMQGHNGEPTLGFAPWSLLIKDTQEIEIYSTALISQPLEVEKDAADAYIQNTTGLIMSGLLQG